VQHMLPSHAFLVRAPSRPYRFMVQKKDVCTSTDGLKANACTIATDAVAG